MTKFIVAFHRFAKAPQNVSDKRRRESQNPFYVNDFFFENRAVYEIKCKDVVEPDRPQMRIWRMRTACWIPKATNTFRICDTVLIAFPLQQWLHERALLLPFTYITCLI
jgi:hypothetical protein